MAKKKEEAAQLEPSKEVVSAEPIPDTDIASLMPKASPFIPVQAISELRFADGVNIYELTEMQRGTFTLRRIGKV